jgi:uncharacterized membrane protein YtjA (UPF0391 family)
MCTILALIRGEERVSSGRINQEGLEMLQWTVIFLVLALIAAFFGFGSLAGTAASIAQVLFFVFLAALVISFFMRRRPPLT